MINNNNQINFLGDNNIQNNTDNLITGTSSVPFAPGNSDINNGAALSIPFATPEQTGAVTHEINQNSFNTQTTNIEGTEHINPLNSNNISFTGVEYAPSTLDNTNSTESSYVPFTLDNTNSTESSYVPFTLDNTNSIESSYVPFTLDNTNSTESSYVPFTLDNTNSTESSYAPLNTGAVTEVASEDNNSTSSNSKNTKNKTKEKESSTKKGKNKTKEKCKDNPFESGYLYSRPVEIPVFWGGVERFKMPLEIQFEKDQDEYSYIKNRLLNEFGIAEAGYPNYQPEYMGGYYELIRVQKKQDTKFLG